VYDALGILMEKGLIRQIEPAGSIWVFSSTQACYEQSVERGTFLGLAIRRTEGWWG
jgi:hypothetical protein